VIAENESQDVIAVRHTSRGGWGLDAAWSDDFHHVARVALTGRPEAYYSDYRGTAQELVSCAKRGHLYQGQYYTWQKKPRGTVVTDEPASAFVFYLQNHDQVANQLRGERLPQLCGRVRYRAIATYHLLLPETPLLFMGQEFGSSRPFLYFADHRDSKLADAVCVGRKKFLAQFPSYAHPDAQAQVPDPCALTTFLSSKLNLGERASHSGDYEFHRTLLALRKADPVIARQSRTALGGAVLASDALALRFFGGDDGDRLLLVNLGRDLSLLPMPEPLLAPVRPEQGWTLLFSSDDPRYGGPGVRGDWHVDSWILPGGSAQLFRS
jgi:maltooligosyltrehalose trehalohydrolase